MKLKFLPQLSKPEFLRSWSVLDLLQLAQEIKHTLHQNPNLKAGHRQSSLAVVELSIALHYCSNTPHDNLIWDVGHQAYAHKLLTGRFSDFGNIRQKNGLSGFTKKTESAFDPFGAGHASTSLSAITGMALSSALKKEKKQHIAVIGDASIVGGMAFEALNFLGDCQANVLIVLNDNAFGIEPSVGALRHHFDALAKQEDLPQFFDSLNIDYLGLVDGADLPAIIAMLNKALKLSKPRVVHVRTHKTGVEDETNKIEKSISSSFQSVVGATMVKLAAENEKIVAISPAMIEGSGLKEMQKKFPLRTYDVGIAEQHAVTMAAGMAAEGMIPYCFIYATFLQRAYDQVIHDVCLQNLPVVFCLDRAGFVGEDGATHHGLFDMAQLRAIPNLVIAAPRNHEVLQNLLYTAQFTQGPIAIRYPRGKVLQAVCNSTFQKFEFGKGSCLKKGTDVAVISVGTMAHQVQKALEKLKNDFLFGHYDLGFIVPLDDQLLSDLFTDYATVVVVEEGVLAAGAGSAILEWAQQNKQHNNIHLLGVANPFIEQASVEEQRQEAGLAIQQICDFLLKLV